MPARWLLLLAAFLPAAALAKDYSVAAGCPPVRLPGSLAGYVEPASDTDAQASGLVSGGRSGVKKTGEGGICEGRVYRVMRPGLKLWRVTSESITAKAMGGWWSASKVDDEFTSRKRWRTANSVCTPWNPKANHIFSCTVDKGAFILLGSTQSVDCTRLNAGTEHFPTSTTQQLTLNVRQFVNLSRCSTPLPILRWTD